MESDIYMICRKLIRPYWVATAAEIIATPICLFLNEGMTPSVCEFC